MEIVSGSILICFFSQEAIFRVIAAILHIGNIDFAKGKEIDSSVIKDDKGKFHLKTAAELLLYDHFFILKFDLSSTSLFNNDHKKIDMF